MSDLLMSKTLESDERDEIQFERLVEKRKKTFESLLVNKEQAKVETREIPLQLLALEWFNKIEASIETRAYLVENFLPILVLGCEKILKDAQQKKLVDQNKKDSDFNPINLLAQYLMRNNPKYNNHNETSAYVRTMREVYQQLREQMFAFQENKLAKVKADIRQRRTDRETIQKTRQTEINRRGEKLENLFAKWHISSNGRIEMAVVIESLKLYNNYTAKLPSDTRKSFEINVNSLPSYCFNRDGMNLTKRVLRSEFVQCMVAVTDNLTSEFFDIFIDFMFECSNYFVSLANRTKLNKILKRLFQLVDSTDTGLLTRRRLIRLLDEFLKNQSMPEIKDEFRDPMEWPILDPVIKYENKLDTSINVPSLNLKDINDPGNFTETSVVIDSKSSDRTASLNPEEETKPADSSETLPDVKPEEETVENSAESADPEKLSEDKSETDTKPASPKPAKAEAVATNSDQEINEEDYIPQTTNISKENELLFLNGGILYYKPLETTLSSFDTGLIQEQKNPRAFSASKKTKPNSCQVAFDTEYLDAKQFLNIVRSYMRPGVLDSEKAVNDFIVFLKDNYAENQVEKTGKLEKTAFEKKATALRERISNCFEKLDNEGSGVVNLSFLVTTLESFKEGLFVDQIQEATEVLKAKIQIGNGSEDDIIYKKEFIDYISNLISLVDFAKFEDQIMNYLGGLIVPTNKVKARGETRKVWLQQIETIGELGFGSFEQLYKQLFLSLLKDSETHSDHKNISAYVAILENTDSNIGLKFHASTPYDSNFILGKTLARETPNVTFKVIDEGKFSHFESVQSEDNVHYFNPDNQRDGSLIIFPLKYSRNKTFGTISIDSIQEGNTNNKKFIETEISFFQGVANTFAKSYTNIISKNRMAKTINTAIEWLSERCQAIEACNVYIVQLLSNETRLVPEEKASNDSMSGQDAAAKINLKPVMKYLFKDQSLVDNMKDSTENNTCENKIGSQLYECAATSETTVDTFNSRTCFSFPLRNEQNKTIFVIEFITKDLPDINKILSAELEQIETVIYVLDKCQNEILNEHFAGISNCQYKFESQFEHEKFEILFEKIFLKVTTDKLAKSIDNKIIELLPDGTESPETSKTKDLFKLIADLTGTDIEKTQIITAALLEQLKAYDPTADSFKFNESQSRFNLNKTAAQKELHAFNCELCKENSAIKMLANWACLQRSMKLKVEKAKQNLK